VERSEVARAPLIFAHRFGRWDLTRTPRVVGILNVTPDSFSDGGRFVEPREAARHAERLIEEGADAIDVGGQSTRPGAGEPVGVEEEWARIGPVVKALRARARGIVAVSVDTYRAEVARRALAEGAAMINDVTALAYEPALADVVAEAEAGLVLMHSRGGPSGFHDDEMKEYDDVVDEVRWELYMCLRRALVRSVPEESIAHAMRDLVLLERLVTEGAGAAPVGALLTGNLDLRGRHVGVILSGRNVDAHVIRRVLS